MTPFRFVREGVVVSHTDAASRFRVRALICSSAATVSRSACVVTRYERA
jgi:hypothetical protein